MPARSRNSRFSPIVRTRGREGFTLIELIVVITIIGILAGLALVHFAALTDKAKLASVMSDVRNAEFAEEGYYAAHAVYGTQPQLQTAGTLTLSPGVTMTITPAANGYTVVANDASISSGDDRCTVKVGGVASPGTDGKIVCD